MSPVFVPAGDLDVPAGFSKTGDTLPSNSKQLFREHLENKSMFNNNQSMLYPSALIEFKAVLNANTSEEIYKLIHDYLELVDPKIRDAAFYGLTDLTKKKLKQIYN